MSNLPYEHFKNIKIYKNGGETEKNNMSNSLIEFC